MERERKKMPKAKIYIINVLVSHDQKGKKSYVITTKIQLKLCLLCVNEGNKQKPIDEAINKNWSKEWTIYSLFMHQAIPCGNAKENKVNEEDGKRNFSLDEKQRRWEKQERKANQWERRNSHNSQQRERRKKRKKRSETIKKWNKKL